jgi:hypothetical protein
MPWPRLEAGVLVLAALALLVALMLSPQTWYAPACRLPATSVSAVWTLWRAVAFGRARAHYRAWTATPLWEVEAADLERYHT